MLTGVHQTAICLTENIAPNVSIGPYCVIEAGAVVEDGACLAAHAFIGKGARIGADSQIGAGARVGSGCIVERSVVVGANAVLADQVHVRISACIAPGTNVSMPVPPYAIVSGRDGAITGYVDAASDLLPTLVQTASESSQESRVRGVRTYKMREFPDLRGALSVGEFGAELPFIPKRYFLVYDVLNEQTRGEHAHKACHQFLLCVHGACSVLADDGHNREEFRLDHRTVGLHLPPMVWGVQYKFTRDAVLLVFASAYYDPADYIRDYGEFAATVAGGPQR